MFLRVGDGSVDLVSETVTNTGGSAEVLAGVEWP